MAAAWFDFFWMVKLQYHSDKFELYSHPTFDDLYGSQKSAKAL
jgi:hypothetical protein